MPGSAAVEGESANAMSVQRLETSLDRVLRRRPNFSPASGLRAVHTSAGEIEGFVPTHLPPIPAEEFTRAPRIARLHPGWIVAVLVLAIVALARAGVTP